MSARENASALLGQYLLKGYTMLAASCQQCHSYPLMGRGDVRFCVACVRRAHSPVDVDRCDPLPDAQSQPAPIRAAAPSIELDEHDTEDSASVGQAIEPIEASHSSPPTTAPPSPQPAVDIARRAQSDRASAAIARLLLQGWTMLADECSNPTCYGVPLMRRPKPRPKTKAAEKGTSEADVAANIAKRRFGGRAAAKEAVVDEPKQDMRRLCVICEREYMSEEDAQAAAASSAPPAGASQTLARTQAGPSQPRKRPRDLDPSVATPKGKARAVEVAPPDSALAPPIAIDGSAATAVASLEAAMLRLSRALDLSTDPTAIGEAADALSKVARALKDVRTLQ